MLTAAGVATALAVSLRDPGEREVNAGSTEMVIPVGPPVAHGQESLFRALDGATARSTAEASGVGAAHAGFGAAMRPASRDRAHAPYLRARRVTSDLLVGAELTELHVQVFDRDGVAEWGMQTITLTTEPDLPAQYTLPASFALTPGADDVREFRLVMTGRGPLGGGARDGSGRASGDRHVPLARGATAADRISRGAVSGSCVAVRTVSVPT